ncbi:hypothetical protein E3Q15_01706 [Wallemia mellicola]|nr:hypothetical protein E3Q15_01706 [Wallemia mellicola]TIC29536.1 hypothetical protein E3Q11_01363 [Wallemia mellicola]TIC57968.1 hypothetical protein E3Q05_01001 [Wallemia mellicola]TIC75136.1 hypothetical protein E3Q00_01237 [Wallemia mellicola]
MALPPRPIRQETLEFENLLSDLISQDRDSINYPDEIHTPSYAGSYQDNDFLNSQFPQSPASSAASSFSRSRSPSISSYDSNINDNDDYGFSNLNFNNQHNQQPATLQIPDHIPDLNFIEATPIAKTPTQVEYELKGQPFSFPTQNRPRSSSDSIPPLPPQNFLDYQQQEQLPQQPQQQQQQPQQQSPKQYSLGRSFGHRRCRSGGREGAGTPNYGLRLKPDYKVDQQDKQSQSNPLNDLEFPWIESNQNTQQSVSPNNLHDQSPFDSSTNIFDNVAHTTFTYMQSNSPYNTSSSSLYSSPPNNFTSSPPDNNFNSPPTQSLYVDSQPDLNSLDYPNELNNDYMNIYNHSVNIIPPPIVHVDSIHSSPAAQSTQLKNDSSNSSTMLPTLLLPTNNDNDNSIDDPTPVAATMNSNMSAARGVSTNFSEKPILTAKPTTDRTRIASNSRRKHNADGKAPKIFVCEVPGCGSSFTRQFNRHMRSHTNERPFVCSFDGCGKAFARQHDKKRHEALHQDNNKPYKCLGCSKKFARIDGLARHHKSDLGKDCALKHIQIEESKYFTNSSDSISNMASAVGSGVLM